MRRLEKHSYAAAYDLYQSQEAFFPLIATVLLGEQAGVVYGDSIGAARHFYVEHASGFAQVFGGKDAEFDLALNRYLVIDKAFTIPKVRLYTPRLPDFLTSPNFDKLRSERQRFVYGRLPAVAPKEHEGAQEEAAHLRPVQKNELAVVESTFNVVSRFWGNDSDFIEKSLAVVAWQGSQPLAICYAAALAKGQAEIDVLTVPAYRRTGLGRQVVLAFIEHCIQNAVQPMWDCFTNNVGSMGLCRTSGFVAARPAYAFYTFDK